MMRNKLTTSLLCVGIAAWTPAFADLTSYAALELCGDQAYGFCQVSKSASENYDYVEFNCEVTSMQHSPTQIDWIGEVHSLKLDEVDSKVINGPHVSPIHIHHKYCRTTYGNDPNRYIVWQRLSATPGAYFLGRTISHQTCKPHLREVNR